MFHYGSLLVWPRGLGIRIHLECVVFGAQDSSLQPLPRVLPQNKKEREHILVWFLFDLVNPFDNSRDVVRRGVLVG